MRIVDKNESDSKDADQDNNSFVQCFFRDPQPHFFYKDNKEVPRCNLLLIGDYHKSAICSKKTELLSQSKYEQLSKRHEGVSLFGLGIQDGVLLTVIESSTLGHCARCYGFPFYSTATMIAIIPNCAMDLKSCYCTFLNSYPKYGMVKQCKIVYVNMFDIDSDEYHSIEEEARKLNFSDHKLILRPLSVDNLINVAIQHSRKVCNRLNPPEVAPEEPEGSSSKCCIM